MTDNRDFMDLLVLFDGRIGLLGRRWRFDDDIASEAIVSLLQHVVDGVIDEHELCRCMDVDVRRYTRREEKQRSLPDRLRAVVDSNDSADAIERVIARLDVIRACAQLDVPPEAAAWVDHVTGCRSTAITAAQRMAGHRWRNRVLKRAGPDTACA